MASLPMEIVTLILTNLPVESLLRFRTVSKSWCNLIDSTDFTQMHLQQSKKIPSNHSLILGGLGLYAINLKSLDRACPLKTPTRGSDFLNACNGLVLVMTRENPVIWNPFTRRYKVVPPAPQDYPTELPLTSAYEAFAFGYDSRNDDYKVVRVLSFYGMETMWAKVFSLRSNSWKTVADFPYMAPYKRVWGVHLNGTLHTLVESYVRYGNNNVKISVSRTVIMAYDISREEHYMVEVPDGLPENATLNAEVMGGFLCLVVLKKRYRSDVWVMKDYRVKESWCKVLTVSRSMVEPYVTLCPLVYSENGNEILLNVDDKWLVWYDLKGKTVRNVAVDGLPYVFYAEATVQSLISPEEFGVDCVKKEFRPAKRKGKVNRKGDDFLSEGFKLIL